MAARRRKARVWTVAAVAEHAGISHGRALRLLKKLDAKHGGKLLTPSDGRVNRAYTLNPATLRRLEPDLFASFEDESDRIEALEEEVAELRAMLRRVAIQVGANTRGIEGLREATRPTIRAATKRVA